SVLNVVILKFWPVVVLFAQPVEWPTMVAVPVPSPTVLSENVTYIDVIPQPVFPPSAATQLPLRFANACAALALDGANATVADAASNASSFNATVFCARNIAFLLGSINF